MKLSNDIAIKWTIFKMERNSVGEYGPVLEVDDEWVEKQRDFLNQSKQKVVYIIADLFADYVYACNLSDSDTDEFIDNVNRKLTKSKKYLGIVSSKSLFKEQNKDEKIEKYSSLKSKIDLKDVKFRNEMKRRSKLYNSGNYIISDNELLDITIKSFVMFEFEKKLLANLNIKDIIKLNL